MPTFWSRGAFCTYERQFLTETNRYKTEVKPNPDAFWPTRRIQRWHGHSLGPSRMPATFLSGQINAHRLSWKLFRQ